MHEHTLSRRCVFSRCALCAQALHSSDPGAFVQLLLAAAGALAPVIRRFIGLGLNRVWLSAGEMAFSKGDQASCLFVLISGRVRIVSGDARAGGRKEERKLYNRDGVGIDEAGRGDTIGEAGMLAGGAHPHTALCVRDSELVRMSRSAFELITAKSPAAAARLLESMARKAGVNPR